MVGNMFTNQGPLLHYRFGLTSLAGAGIFWSWSDWYISGTAILLASLDNRQSESDFFEPYKIWYITQESAVPALTLQTPFFCLAMCT